MLLFQANSRKVSSLSLAIMSDDPMVVVTFADVSLVTMMISMPLPHVIGPLQARTYDSWTYVTVPLKDDSLALTVNYVLDVLKIADSTKCSITYDGKTWYVGTDAADLLCSVNSRE
jgi:hypothetical protein